MFITSTMGIVDFLKPSTNASDSLPDLIAHEDWKLVVMESKMHPRNASVWALRKRFFDGEHDSRNLPIHQACALCPPKEVIHALYECYPQGVKTGEDTFKRLPLHIACQTNASVETIEALIRYYPEGTRCKDTIGRLPIHYACAHDAPLNVLELLLRTFPASAGCGDNNGWLPIHVACRRGSPVGSIRLLLDWLPQSADMATKKGSTPVMCARKGGNDRRHEDIVEFIEDYIKNRSLSSGKLRDAVLSPGMTEIRHRNVHARGA
ncbi:hypothetical protein ACHAXS_010360 [Conticribra weissflogii]